MTLKKRTGHRCQSNPLAAGLYRSVSAAAQQIWNQRLRNSAQHNYWLGRYGPSGRVEAE